MATYRREILSKAPVIGIVLKLSEVGAIRPADVPAAYWDLLSTNDHLDTLQRIAIANNLLLERPHDPGVHRAIEELFLQPTHRERLLAMAKDERPHPVFPLAFSRLGNLLNMKLLLSSRPYAHFRILRGTVRRFHLCLAALRRSLAGLRRRRHSQPPGVDPRDFLVGDLAVLSNEYTGSARIRAGGTPSPMDLMLEFVPRWEIDNTPDLAYSWSRITRMFTHVSGPDPVVAKLRSAIKLDPRNLRFHGLSAEEFIAAAFAVYTQVRRISPSDRSKCIIDVKTLASELRMLPTLMRRFLQNTATTTATYEALLRPNVESAEALRDRLSSDDAATDVVLLRQRPILRLRRSKFLILDAQFVAGLVGSQMYWMTFDSLHSTLRNRFQELWGRSFELYLTDLLRHYYPSSAQLLHPDVPYDAGQIDALLDLGDVVLVFEFKASLLLRDAKFSRDPTQFEAEVRRKFVENEKGKPKALRQLVNSATAVADRRVRTTIPPERIFPVLVTDEATFQSLGVNAYLNQLFRPLVPPEHARRVRPLTVMSVEEFEEVLPHVAMSDISWQTLFEERFTGESVALESVHQIMYFHHEQKGMALRRNDFLLDEFKNIFESMVERYRTPAN